jgi:hypothetical protein
LLNVPKWDTEHDTEHCPVWRGNVLQVPTTVHYFRTCDGLTGPAMATLHIWSSPHLGTVGKCKRYSWHCHGRVGQLLPCLPCSAEQCGTAVTLTDCAGGTTPTSPTSPTLRVVCAGGWRPQFASGGEKRPVRMSSLAIRSCAGVVVVASSEQVGGRGPRSRMSRVDLESRRDRACRESIWRATSGC